MINKIPELKRLELNKQNVMKILFDCKATENSKKLHTLFHFTLTNHLVKRQKYLLMKKN